MKAWKYNQFNYYSLVNQFEDSLDDKEVITIKRDDPEFINKILLYFRQKDVPFIYPPKSYFVGIVYARLLVDYFGEEFYEVLSDPDLLYGNDSCFLPYDQDKEVYDSVIQHVGLDFDLTGGMVPDVFKYFQAEMLGK